MRFKKISWQGNALHAEEGYKLIPAISDDGNAILWIPWFNDALGNPMLKQEAKQVCRKHFKSKGADDSVFYDTHGLPGALQSKGAHDE